MKIYLRSNLPNLFKIRRDLRKLWRNTFGVFFYAPQCICRIHVFVQGGAFGVTLTLLPLRGSNPPNFNFGA